MMVHSMPTPQDGESVTLAPGGRWKMLAIMLVCSLPVIASYFAYFGVRPSGHASLGELITPVRPVPDQVATALDGSVHPLAELKGQWLLVSVAGGACLQGCPQHLFLQRQLRETLGKDRDRVDWVWFISDQVAVPASLKPALAGAQVLRVDAQVLQAWLAQPGAALTESLFVVDPMGNAMMRFPAQFDNVAAGKARRDLERLLRASAAWDGPGR